MILKVSLAAILIGIAYLSLSPTTTVTVGSDKISHFIAYSILMVNIGLVTLPKMKAFRTGILFALSYGMLMEIGQLFVPGRSFSFYDMLANALGVSIGMGVSILLGKTILRMLKAAKII